MKKIFLLFATALLFMMNCKDDEVPQPLSIEGSWKVLKEVRTTVLNGGQPDTDNFFYTEDCEQMSRYIFNADLSGKVMVSGPLNGGCSLLSDKSMNYIYDSKTGAIIINYIAEKDEGFVTDLTETTMNLKIEIIKPSVYESRTYTLVKAN